MMLLAIVPVNGIRYPGGRPYAGYGATKCGASLPTSTFYGNAQTQTTRPERTVSSSVNLRPARIKLLSIEAENVALSAHINFTKTLVGAV